MDEIFETSEYMDENVFKSLKVTLFSFSYRVAISWDKIHMFLFCILVNIIPSLQMKNEISAQESQMQGFWFQC